MPKLFNTSAPVNGARKDVCSAFAAFREVSARITFRHCLFCVALVFPGVSAQAQLFTDPGFESYSVAGGQFVRPTSGPWLFGSDAAVVEPPAPNSSTGPLSTWSATFPAFEGQQYASTYAGGDTLRQSLSFAAAGPYQISVYAAAPSGVVTIPQVGPQTLVDGSFTFTLGNAAIGSVYTVSAGMSWQLFTAPFTINAPGNYLLGIRNTAAAPYFINYDKFVIQAVPEPAVWQFALVGLGLLCFTRRRVAS